MPEPQPAKPTRPAAGATFVYVGGRQGIHLFRLQTSNLEVSQNITLAPLAVEVAGFDTFFTAGTSNRMLVTSWQRM